MIPDLDGVFSALSDPTRREILRRLGDGELSTGQLAAPFDMTRPAISQHLRILYDAGLVDRRKEGRNQLYAVRPEPLDGAREWLDRYSRHWRSSLRGLKTRLESGQEGPR